MLLCVNEAGGYIGCQGAVRYRSQPTWIFSSRSRGTNTGTQIVSSYNSLMQGQIDLCSKTLLCQELWMIGIHFVSMYVLFPRSLNSRAI